LEQAGYDQADSLAFLCAEDMTFLMKFVYKSQLLGPAAEDLTFDTFDLVDLTGCSLPTIPIVLHQNAGSIVILNLSRNPMVEIPLDFIQSCTTLRDLKLSSMAMKKVPQSVRHSTSLHRLDLSCNRIVDLDDAGLDRIPELSSLRLQNNRIEQLPWYFPRLKFLKFLNISNNKFVNVPSVICQLPCLVELDMSFNTITELPEEIGRLTTLERLILIGNQVVKLPEECRNLVNLQLLDCRRNNISDISIAYALPKLQTLNANHNSVHALHLSIGPNLSVLDASHNDITFLKFAPGSPLQTSHTLTLLDVSYAKLSSLDAFDFSQLPALQTLKLDHNELRTLPDSLGELSHLIHLSCCDNKLVSLPSTIGLLQRLETLDAHNNSLTELPVSLWNCASLTHINVTSNLLASWHDPPGDNLIAPAPSGITLEIPSSSSACHTPRKPSNATYTMSIHNAPGRALPPLAYSLERLSIGENRLTEEAIPPFTILKELRVLNLSFNEIQELPSSFLRNLQQLEELYLSGNQLTSIPTEDLVKMTRLSVLFLNGNKFQTLPAELGKIPSLTIIDAGSNLLRYNIHNWEFDWNWNFNCNLKYLNLSGNKKLDLKQNNGGKRVVDEHGRVLSDFSRLSQLRVLGLMDVMTTFLPNIPEDSDERRVRTSQTEVNGMSYGIADTIGRNGYLTTLDLVLPEFRGKKDEALFAMFGRTKALPGNNTLSKYLHDNYASVFTEQLLQIKKDQKGERRDGVPDAMRRTFLKLNRQLHDKLYSQPSRKMSQVSASTTGPSGPDSAHLRQGASGIVVYVVDRTLYVANVGHALAVISSQGNAELISRNHDPYDRDEARRIRLAEGWISPKGLIHDEVDTSRAFGYFHDFPVVNARPDIYVRQLTELDEFVIIGNRGLWQYISYQTAVDIARSEADPMIAAQKLRDFAISYGADGNTMIMVICVSDLFRSRQPITDSLVDPEVYSSINKKRAGKKADIVDRTIARLEGEVSPPIGHLCLVFTDIRNSTQLWEANAGMPTAMRIHNNLLRRHLRTCGGYVVKTEGDAFMCSFPTTLAAMWWCLIVQLQLLREPWPLEILECPEGKEVYDEHGQLLARGLSVRMGVHCGIPVYEPDPITGRMDYFGPMVIRAARISGIALGGQIMCSADVVRELNAKIFENGQDTEYSEFQPTQAIEAIRQMRIALVPAGEVKLKGLEIPEMVSLVYPVALLGRQDLDASGLHLSTSTSTARVQLSIAQVKDLAMLCLRIEALSSGRIFRPRPEQKESVSDLPLEPLSDEDVLEPSVMYGDPNLLLPPMNEKTSDLEIMMHLDSLSLRLENAVACLALKKLCDKSSTIVSALENHEGIDERTLNLITSLLSRC
jgi:adenylate cyclase